VTSPDVRLSAAVKTTLLADAHAATRGEPTEICGILSGRADDETQSPIISAFHSVTNVASDTRRAYELDPAETIEQIDELESAGDTLVGFYHSHPVSPAEPSQADREQAAWPGYLYAIASVPDNDIAVFEWTGETFAPRTVRIVEAD